MGRSTGVEWLRLGLLFEGQAPELIERRPRDAPHATDSQRTGKRTPFEEPVDRHRMRPHIFRRFIDG